MPVDMRQLGERLKLSRRRRGLRQTTLAKATGLDLSNLNDLEHARKPGVKAETLATLAEALEVSSDYLLGLTDDPQPCYRGGHPMLEPEPMPPQSFIRRAMATPFA